MKKPKVIFLCTHNAARSQIAEALLRQYASHHFDVESAGYQPAQTINPFALQVLHEIGITTEGQRPKGVKELMGWDQYAYMITVCAREEENCPVTFPGVYEYLAWPVDDPAAVEGSDAEKLAKFREVRDQMAVRIRAWLAEIGVAPVIGA